MKIPIIKGIIDRRILANYRIDPDVIKRNIPSPFRPKLVAGCGMGGICIIRISGLRPVNFPLPIGIRAENCAHRFAVEWDTSEGIKEGVYIPRRDTSSVINAFAGGRIFPGIQHRAKFDIREEDNSFHIALRSHDGTTYVEIDAKINAELPDDSVFKTLDEASAFFKEGSVGFSPIARSKSYDCIELRTKTWAVNSLDVQHIHSSFFEESFNFPKNTAVFDHALLMRNIDHEWHGHDKLYC